MFSKEKSLCVSSADEHFSVLCTSTKHSLWFVPTIHSSEAPEQPGAARILLPDHPRAFQQLARVCLTLYCHIDAMLPCQGGEAYERPAEGTPPFAAGPCLQLGACTDESNLQTMSLQCRQNHYVHPPVSYSSIIANVNGCS